MSLFQYIEIFYYLKRRNSALENISPYQLEEKTE